MENDENIKQYHRMNVIFWGSILSFVVILTVLGYILDSLNTLRPVQNAAQVNQIMFLLAVVIAFGILFFKRSLFNPKKLIDTPFEKPLPEKINLVLAKLRKNYIIVWAMGETIGIIGFVNYILTVDIQYLLVFSVVSIYSILINLPRIAIAKRCVELVKENH
jgi:MFS family permease